MKNLKEYIITENKFFKNLGIGISRIEKWLDEHKITNYTINDDLTIDVKGNVYLYKYPEKEFPNYIQFGCVDGHFDISACSNLTTLEGCPQIVGRDFSCIKCSKLESLQGCPKEIGGDFFCDQCSKLESLEGLPKEVGGDFYCKKCGKQFTIDDVKKVCKVKRNIFV